MAVKFYRLSPKQYDGFRYQIAFFTPLPWEAVNWCYDDRENRRLRFPEIQGTDVKAYLELKNRNDLLYCLLCWA